MSRLSGYAYGWSRLRRRDGERWTQCFRSIVEDDQESAEEQSAGEEERHSEKSPAVQDKPILEAHGLFWKPTTIIVSVPRKPVRLNPVGIGLALIGAALMIIGVFLPRVESQQFFKVPDTLFQSGDGWIFIALAICIEVAVGAAMNGRRRTYAVLILAVLGIAFGTYYGTGERLELSSLNPAAAAVLGGSTETASPGTGLYAVVAGSGLAAVGGLLLAGMGSWVSARLAHWVVRPWKAARGRWRIGELRHGGRSTATPQPGS